MKSRDESKKIVFILGSLLVTTIAWIVFDTYRAFTSVGPPDDVEEFLTVINPELKMGAIEAIEKRMP